MAIIREFSAGGIIIKRFKDGFKVLLIRDGYGKWAWPKGNIEKGETSEEAAFREIEEEVGLKRLKILERIDEVKYFYRLGGKLIFKTVYLYIIEALAKEKLIPLKSEIQDARWFTPEEAMKLIEYKGASKILEIAIKKFQAFMT